MRKVDIPSKARLAASILLAGAVTAGCYRPISQSQDQVDFVEQYRQKSDPFKPNTYIEEYKIDPTAPEAIVSKHTWVEVKNNYPISHQNGTRINGDTCSLGEGEKIKLVRPAAEGRDQVLVIYQPNTERAGAECAYGTLSEMSEANFNSSTQEFNDRQMKRQIENQLVADLLSRNYAEKSPEKAVIQIVPKQTWVDLTTNRDKYTRDSCIVQIGSSVQLIGEDPSSDRVLVRYQLAPNKADFMLCPDKAIFFTPKAEFDGMTADFWQNGERRVKQEEQLKRRVENERTRRILTQSR